MMTNKQVRWAMQHDWYIGSRVVPNSHGYIVVVRDYVPVEGSDTEFEEWQRDFDDFDDLKAWAGY